MNNDWKEFILTQNPEIIGDSVHAFHKPRQEAMLSSKADVIADLSYMGLLEVSGIDAASFLQGQLSCDLNKIKPNTSQLGTYCNNQGRMLSTFRLYKIAETYYLYMPQSVIQTILNELQKYALFSKVSLANASNNKVCLGLSGPHAAQTLSHYFSVKPNHINEVVIDKQIAISQVQGTLPRYVLIADSQAMISFWRATQAQNVAPIGEIGWRLLNIMAGVPTIYPATQAQFIPHRVNYHLLNGLDFNKGCYLGQEIIARFHYRGTFKHHMYRLWLDTEQIFEPGEPLRNENNHVIGQLIDQVPDPASGSQALVILQIGTLNHQLVMPDEASVGYKVLELPYPLD